MDTCDFCGQPKNSLKTYSVQTGYMWDTELNKKYLGQGLYETTTLYTDIKWHRFLVCNTCRWKWNLLYPSILASAISILFGIGWFIFWGDSILYGFTVFPGVLLGGHFLFRIVHQLKIKARRRVREQDTSLNKKSPIAVLKINK